MALIECEECEHSVSDAAVSCPSCGNPINPPELHLHPRWSPGVAAVLSLIIPGTGQLYKGQILNGFAWFLCVGVGYLLFFVPGVFLHLCCILGAASGDPRS